MTLSAVLCKILAFFYLYFYIYEVFEFKAIKVIKEACSRLINSDAQKVPPGYEIP